MKLAHTPTPASFISDAKNGLVSPEQYEPVALDPLAKAAAKVYRELEIALRSANAVSFDDLLVLLDHPVQRLDRRQRDADGVGRMYLSVISAYAERRSELLRARANGVRFSHPSSAA